MAGPQALNRVSSAGTLVGLDLPPASKNFEIKPYAISRLSTDRVRATPINNDFDADLGGDIKYGVTANLTADFTINTDFAQVEIDEQQVNLTRFSLFFPEKRDFFLEGRGVFDFARGGAGAQMGAVSATDTPTLFYSRRIGLNAGRVIPIEVGGRLTGKVGDFGIGLMNIQAGDEAVSRHAGYELHRRARQARHPPAQHGRRDVHQSVRLHGRPRARTRPMASTRRWRFTRTSTSAPTGPGPPRPALPATTTATRGSSTTWPIAMALRAEFLKVGDNFNPEVGFLRRDDFKRSFASGALQPAPAQHPPGA